MSTKRLRTRKKTSYSDGRKKSKEEGGGQSESSSSDLTPKRKRSRDALSLQTPKSQGAGQTVVVRLAMLYICVGSVVCEASHSTPVLGSPPPLELPHLKARTRSSSTSQFHVSPEREMVSEVTWDYRHTEATPPGTAQCLKSMLTSYCITVGPKVMDINKLLPNFPPLVS